MMRFRKTMCALLALTCMMAVGCTTKVTENHSDTPTVTAPPVDETVESYEEIKTFMGESASFGNMTVTVTKVMNPEIIMENSGKMAVFFELTIKNDTEAAVETNYLNNFALTVDGTYFESQECFTIPAMKKLYDATGAEAFQTEIAPGSSVTGTLAAEVPQNFNDLHLHFIPKTTDRGSRVTVELSKDDMTPME